MSFGMGFTLQTMECLKSNKATTKQMAKIAKLVSKRVPGFQKWHYGNDHNDDGNFRYDVFVTESEKEAKKVMNAVKKFSDVATLYGVWEGHQEIEEYERENLEQKLNDRQSKPSRSKT